MAVKMLGRASNLGRANARPESLETRPISLLATSASRCHSCHMSGSNGKSAAGDSRSPRHLAPEQARALLDSVPARPRRQLGLQDHLSALAAVVLSLASGVMALSGYALWAILPAGAAVAVGSSWIYSRRQRANEPQLGPIALVFGAFGAGVGVPIYRAIRHGETVPFPESLVLGGLGAAVWLVYYLWLFVRR